MQTAMIKPSKRETDGRGFETPGTAFSEPTLIKLASGYEAATQVRAHNLPTFPGTAPDTHIQGTTLSRPHHPFSKKEARRKSHTTCRLAPVLILGLLSRPGGSKPEAYEN